MKISRDAIHDSLVATYQSLEASILNRVLVENGITDAVLREAIVGDFLYEQGAILDQSWFSEQDQQWYPGVFFSTKPHEEIDSSTVHLPSEQYGMNFFMNMRKAPQSGRSRMNRLPMRSWLVIPKLPSIECLNQIQTTSASDTPPV